MLSQMNYNKQFKKTTTFAHDLGGLSGKMVSSATVPRINLCPWILIPEAPLPNTVAIDTQCHCQRKSHCCSSSIRDHCNLRGGKLHRAGSSTPTAPPSAAPWGSQQSKPQRAEMKPGSVRSRSWTRLRWATREGVHQLSGWRKEMKWK